MNKKCKKLGHDWRIVNFVLGEKLEDGFAVEAGWWVDWLCRRCDKSMSRFTAQERDADLVRRILDARYRERRLGLEAERATS